MRALALLLALLASPLSAEEVDIELFLAVDVSRSMTPEELDIQRQGYASALTSPEVLAAIRRGLTGAIAVTYVEWAGSHSQTVIVPWTRLSTPEEAAAIAEIITENFETPRRLTSISAILNHAAKSFDANDFNGLRRVIDVSGDGPNNSGPPVTSARDAALAQGIVINGLPLMTRDALSDHWGIPDLDAYYLNCVIGGPGSFMIPVQGWPEFAPALRRKLVLEIAAAPLPAPDRLHRAAGQLAYDCFIGEKIFERNTNRYWDMP